MKILQNTSLLSILSIALLIIFLTGCGTDGDHDDHDETPIGIVLTVGDTELVMQVESTVTYASENRIFLNQGETLGPILVEFIAEDGDRFLPHSDEGFSLQYSANNSNMITIEQVSGANAWTIQMTGNVVGDTSINFELMHNGHADFQSLPFQVRIVESQQ